MTLACVYLAVALLVGALALRQPALPLRSWPLLLVAALPQVAVIFGLRTPIQPLISIVALVIWGWRNRATPGSAIIVAGSVLNLTAMLFHGGAMPVHPLVAQQLGFSGGVGTALVGSKDVVADLATTALLADSIVVPLALVKLALSPGDLVIVVGLGWWLFGGQKEKVRVFVNSEAADAH